MLPGTHGWWFSQDAEIAQLHAKQAAEEAMALPFFYDLGGRLGAYLAGQKEGGKTHGPGCFMAPKKEAEKPVEADLGRPPWSILTVC